MGVLESQQRVSKLLSELHQMRLRIAEKEKTLEALVEKHQRQIRKSLTSKDETEKNLALSIAAWWDIPAPPE